MTGLALRKVNEFFHPTDIERYMLVWDIFIIFQMAAKIVERHDEFLCQFRGYPHNTKYFAKSGKANRVKNQVNCLWCQLKATEFKLFFVMSQVVCDLLHSINNKYIVLSSEKSILMVIIVYCHENQFDICFLELSNEFFPTGTLRKKRLAGEY
jgi:hypothetical protein